MRQKTLWILLLLFISALQPCNIRPGKACASMDWEPDEEKYSFFEQKIMNDEVNEPFLFSYHITSLPEDETLHSLYNPQNLVEWKNYLNVALSDSDLNNLIYKYDLAFIDSLTVLNAPKQAAKDKWVHPENKKWKQALTYLSFAKQCEPVCTPQVYYWRMPEPDTLLPPRLIEAYMPLAEKCSDTFLKQRYAFQILRLYFFSDNYTAAIEWYNRNFSKTKKQNTITARAAGYMAAACNRSGNFALANYIYAKQFMTDNDDLKRMAQWSFHPVEESDLKQSLSLCKTTDEKISLWQLFGITTDGLRAMKEINALKKGGTDMDLLLMRSVALAEISRYPLNEMQYYDRNDGVRFYGIAAADSNFADLKNFVSKIVNEGTVAKPALWNLTAGYLYFMDSDYVSAHNYFVAAEAKSDFNDTLKTQIHIIEILMTVIQQKDITPAYEASIVKELTWLKQADEFNSKKERAFNYCMRTLFEYYETGDEKIKAEMCRLVCDANYDAETIEEIISFLNKTNKTEFEYFLANNYMFTLSNLYDALGTRFLYEGNPAKAMPALQKAGEQTNEGLYGDPFLIHINDCHDCDHAADHAAYNKFTFAQRMAELNTLAEKDKKNAGRYYFEMANGFYNITWYGNCREAHYTVLTTCQQWANYDSYYYYYYEDARINRNLLFNCNTALDYYQKAMNNSTDKEFKAKCCWMSAKCELNLFYEGMLDYGPKFNYGDVEFLNGNYFEMMRKDFADTKYYQEVINECGYFRKASN